ncbi:MAG: NfeD family protein [Oscillospiraceae bacterium]
MNAIFWAIVLIVTVILEISTFQMVSIWFSVGSLIALISSLFVSFPYQLTIFIVVSILMLILTRPLIKKHMKVNFKPTNHELNVGKIAIVTETINKAKQTGRVSLGGVEWTAITETFEPIEVGSQVVVLKVEGAKLLVSKN